MSLRVNIDYAEGDHTKGPGVYVTREGKTIASWNSGDPQADWSAFIDWSWSCGEEVVYGSSITETGLYKDIASCQE